jgi:hypothetical protein
MAYLNSLWFILNYYNIYNYIIITCKKIYIFIIIHVIMQYNLLLNHLKNLIIYISNNLIWKDYHNSLNFSSLFLL